MKEEWFQSMYQQIRLSERQKNRIRAGIREKRQEPGEGKEIRFTLRGAVCVCAVLAASGITVLAANPSYAERLADAFHFYGGSRTEVTAEAEELYAAYGSELNDVWETAAGTVTLDAVLYDDGYACIPFTLNPDAELIPGEDLKADYASRQLWSDILEQAGRDTEGNPYSFQINGQQAGDIACFTQINPIVQEDGSLTGSYLLRLWDQGEGLAQGDVIQRVREVPLPDGEPWGRLLQEGESTEGLTVLDVEIDGEIVKLVRVAPEDEVVAELPLENAPVPKKEVSAAGAALPYGLRADSITLTSLAFYMHGTGDANQPGSKIAYNLFVLLKDGTVVERAESGGVMMMGSRDENGEYEFSISSLFAEPIDPEDVAGIRIMDRGEEICYIPID